MNLEQLTRLIEKRRAELHELTAIKRTLNTEDIIKKSQDLDLLIAEYNELMYKQRKKKLA